MTEEVTKSCDSCIHFDMVSHKCPAFKGMVPLPFLYGTAEHTEPIGDTSIVYEKIADDEWMKRFTKYVSGEK